MNSGDTAWILTSSALVFIMLPGLALFYGGLVRSKNALSTIMQSFVAIIVGCIVWVLWGYSLAFGPDIGGFIGNLDYIGLRNVSAVAAGPYADGIPHQTFMIFQAMFAIITPALITGAFAERVKFTTLIIFIVLWSTIVYAPLAHWVWGAGGWLGLSGWGALDFAGGAVVHVSSGVAALVAAVLFGKRRGLGSEPMQAHNKPFVIIGAALLWFGWFGFNAGSALTSGGSATSAFVVTNIAAAMATLTWISIDYTRKGKVSGVGAATGAIAGLATITPAAGFVGPMPALLIGLAAGTICYFMVELKNKINLDDSLDVFAIHGVGGMLGLLAAGIFAGVGFLDLSAHVLPGVDRGGQIIRQLGAIGAAAGWSLAGTVVILYALKYTIGLRVSDDDEQTGLDITQHGEEAYSD